MKDLTEYYAEFINSRLIFQLVKDWTHRAQWHQSAMQWQFNTKHLKQQSPGKGHVLRNTKQFSNGTPCCRIWNQKPHWDYFITKSRIQSILILLLRTMLGIHEILFHSDKEETQHKEGTHFPSRPAGTTVREEVSLVSSVFPCWLSHDGY